MYKALSAHWIYDPLDPVYIDNPAEIVDQSPLQKSSTHPPRSGLLPFASFYGSEVLLAANPLKGKGGLRTLRGAVSWAVVVFVAFVVLLDHRTSVSP